jgi:SAM-dependent methyltransferase
MISSLRSFGHRLHWLSHRRWSGDEPVAELTWGQVMTGDSLWSVYQRYRRFTPNDAILEIGPGYGRLLRTALEWNVPFQSYIGLELSKARVDRLEQEFKLETVGFVAGDIDTWTSTLRFDVVICSATFEHLHPDCRAALRNIRRHLAPGADIFIDFIGGVPRKFFGIGLAPFTVNLIQNIKFSPKWFGYSGTYYRIYSVRELRKIFAECGYTVGAIDVCTLGTGKGGPVTRLVVAAHDAQADRPV